MLEKIIPTFLTDRERAYRLAFSSPAGKAVLADLAKFCRATETVFNPDPRLTDVLIGRNEVFRRIQNHIHLTPEELYALLSK